MDKFKDWMRNQKPESTRLEITKTAFSDEGIAFLRRISQAYSSVRFVLDPEEQAILYLDPLQSIVLPTQAAPLEPPPQPEINTDFMVLAHYNIGIYIKDWSYPCAWCSTIAPVGNPDNFDPDTHYCDGTCHENLSG